MDFLLQGVYSLVYSLYSSCRLKDAALFCFLLQLFFQGNCSPDVAVHVLGTNYVRMGNSPTISCDATGASRIIRQWTFDPAFGLGKNQTVVASGRISYPFVDKSELSIQRVVKSDEGRYYCHVSVPGQTLIVKSADLFVIVPPTVQARGGKVLEGKSTTLSCIGKDFSSCFWSFKNQPISSNSQKYKIHGPNGEYLDILNISRNDEGAYECRVFNSQFNVKKYPDLVVYYPPAVMRGPENIAVLEGYNAHLSCEVDGSPRPQVIWQHNGKVLDTSRSSRHAKNGVNLLVERVGMNDTGSYSCIAANDYGQVTSNRATLRVQDFPDGTSYKTMLVGSNDSLACYFIAGSNLTITWTKNGQKITPLPSKRLGTDFGEKLLFISVTYDASGEYTCLLDSENAGVERNQTTVITVRGPPSAPQLITSSLRVLLGDLLFLLVNANWTAPKNDGNSALLGFVISHRLVADDPKPIPLTSFQVDSSNQSAEWKVLLDLSVPVYALDLLVQGKNALGVSKPSIKRTAFLNQLLEKKIYNYVLGANSDGGNKSMSTESAMHRNDANTLPVTIAEFTTILPNNRSGSGYENSTSSSANDFGLSNWRYWFIVLSICTSVTFVAFFIFVWITFRSKFKQEKTCNHNCSVNLKNGQFVETQL